MRILFGLPPESLPEKRPYRQSMKPSTVFTLKVQTAEFLLFSSPMRRVVSGFLLKQSIIALKKLQLNGNDSAKLVLEADKWVTINISSPAIGQGNSSISLNQLGLSLRGWFFRISGVKVSPTFSAAIKVEPPGDLQIHGFKILLGEGSFPGFGVVR